MKCWVFNGLASTRDAGKLWEVEDHILEEEELKEEEEEGKGREDKVQYC